MRREDKHRVDLGRSVVPHASCPNGGPPQFVECWTVTFGDSLELDRRSHADVRSQRRPLPIRAAALTGMPFRLRSESLSLCRPHSQSTHRCKRLPKLISEGTKCATPPKSLHARVDEWRSIRAFGAAGLWSLNSRADCYLLSENSVGDSCTVGGNPRGRQPRAGPK